MPQFAAWRALSRTSALGWRERDGYVAHITIAGDHQAQVGIGMYARNPSAHENRPDCGGGV